MEIRHSTAQDFRQILRIYEHARGFMAAHGNPNQWGPTNWPPETLIRSDIAAGNSYVCVCDGRVVGTFFFQQGADIEPAYRKIEDGAWRDASPYGVIHRLAGDGSVKGIGACCIGWAFEQCPHLRVDTHGDNRVLQNLLEKCGFRHCGTIHVAQDRYPRLAYEKTARAVGLQRLTDNIFYYPHQPESDRPMLAYLQGDRFSLAIDAGYSAKHVDGFYAALAAEGIPQPDLTAITHWHYDHTFGMHQINGVSIALDRTNAFLKAQQAKAADRGYIDRLKAEDRCFAKEYYGEQTLSIVLADLEFHDRLTLRLGGLTAELFHTESPHSEDCACVYAPEAKTLFLGDSTSEDFFNGGYLDRAKLASLIRTIEQIDCQTCVLSHAEPLEKAELLEYMRQALTD